MEDSHAKGPQVESQQRQLFFLLSNLLSVYCLSKIFSLCFNVIFVVIPHHLFCFLLLLMHLFSSCRNATKGKKTEKFQGWSHFHNVTLNYDLYVQKNPFESEL